MKSGLVLLFLGIVVLLATSYFGNRGENYQPGSAPECAGKVMSPRDVCVGSGGGDYEEMQAQEEQNREIDKKIGVVGRYVGLAILALAVIQFVRAVIRFQAWRRQSRTVP